MQINVLLTYLLTTTTINAESSYDKIIRLSAVKPKKPFAIYKAHVRDNDRPIWISAEHISPELIVEFNMNRNRK